MDPAGVLMEVTECRAEGSDRRIGYTTSAYATEQPVGPPPTRQTPREAVDYVDTVEGFRVPVSMAGPENGRSIVMFEETRHNSDAYAALRERLHRLHIALLRTVVIAADPRLTDKSVLAILDAAGVASGVLVGDGVGAEFGWRLAATHPERFTGLVVIDGGHPRVADVNGVIRDQDCPHVHVDTTALVSTPAAHAVAQASRRYVLGDFRLAELAGWRGSRHFTAQVATEIVLRAHSW